MRKLLPLLLAVILATACSPKVLPITNSQKDSVFIKSTDSLIIRDSIYIDRLRTIREKGDTVFVTDTKLEYRDRWRDRATHDTLYIDRVIETEKIVKVEKELNWWQKFRIKLGTLALVVLAVALLLAGVRLYRKHILKIG